MGPSLGPEPEGERHAEITVTCGGRAFHPGPRGLRRGGASAGADHQSDVRQQRQLPAPHAAAGNQRRLQHRGRRIPKRAVGLRDNQHQGSSYDSTAIANLPASSPVGNRFVLPSAEAKALGLINGNATAYDGYIGFGTGVSYDYNPRDGISSGAYDFTTVVAHEIDEVLGRISGLSGNSPSWATPFDLFRCSSLSGTRNFSYSAASYFSIDGCKTNMGNFNNVGGGDRSDWASAASFSDIQDAYLYPGVTGTLSTSDLMGLDVIGWGYGPGAPGFGLSPPSLAVVGLNGAPVPEPSTLALLGLGALGLWLRQRRRLPA